MSSVPIPQIVPPGITYVGAIMRATRRIFGQGMKGPALAAVSTCSATCWGSGDAMRCPDALSCSLIRVVAPLEAAMSPERPRDAVSCTACPLSECC